jgi:hypothetical protein
MACPWTLKLYGETDSFDYYWVGENVPDVRTHIPTTPAPKPSHLSQLAGLHLWSLDPESGFSCPSVSQAGCRRVYILDSLFAQLPLIQTGYPSTLANDKWALFDSSRAHLAFRHGFCGVRIGAIRSEGIDNNSIAYLPGLVLVQAHASYTTWRRRVSRKPYKDGS